MSWTRTQASSGDGGSVKVGTTGRISTLMMQELECAKQSQRSSSSHPRRKLQAAEPVSAHCSAVPRRAFKWKKTSSKFGGRGDGDGDGLAHHRRGKPLHVVPMLRPDDGRLMERNTNAGEMEKKGYKFKVEVVDLKCGRNILGTHLSKLRFSKLHGSGTREASSSRRFSGSGNQFQ
ncbi:hypothetical protein Cni_G19145 [Canna indica]|uniref:Uncharacterized protein n=1 Tax=Canna indica TaxID=4628 RepID=A0AAQ3KKM9_9LILI|nr:hypothetical protein Cni_G19145 [Canna indica]